MTLLTQSEVAKIIRKSESWLERMRWAGGGIPYRKIGGRILYEEKDVWAWIESHPKQTSTSQSALSRGVPAPLHRAGENLSL